MDDVLALLRAGADPCARDDAGRNATHHAAAATGARGSSGPAAAAAAAATVRALLDAIDAVPAAPAGAFAKAREPSTPPWDARDLAGRRPVDLCRDGDVAATFRRRRENLERRRRHAGGTPRPDQSRVSSTKPAEWARRAEDARRRAAAWPADAAERAVALAHDILRAVEDTAESRERPRRERPRRERPRRERPRERDTVESRAIRGGSASTFTREEDARSGDGVVAAVGRGGAGGGAAESDVRNGGWIETRRERRRGTVRRVRGTDRVVFAVETEEEGTRRNETERRVFFASFFSLGGTAPSFLSRGEERRGDAPYTPHPTRLPTRSVRRADPRLARARGGCPGLRR